MKKIYILSLCLDAGGVEKCVCLLANAFSKRGYMVTVVNLFESKPIIAFEENVKIETITKFHTDRLKKHTLLYRFFRKFYSFVLLILYLIKLKNAIVISTRNEYSVLLSKYGDKSLLKIAQLHNDHKFNSKLLRDFKYHYKNIDYFVHLTETSCNEISKIMKPYNRKTKIITIPNFVESCEYSECKKENYVIAVGRFSPEKGFMRLIDIWTQVLSKNDNWKLILIGDGPEKNKLIKQIETYNIKDSIILPGFIDNKLVFEYMKKSKIYALTSFEESFSFTLVEAMQNKLALIAFDVRTGPRSLIKENITGYLIPDNELSLFSTKLLSLMQDDKACNRFGKNALLESKNYLEDAVIEKWISIFS